MLAAQAKDPVFDFQQLLAFQFFQNIHDYALSITASACQLTEFVQTCTNMYIQAKYTIVLLNMRHQITHAHAALTIAIK